MDWKASKVFDRLFRIHLLQRCLSGFQFFEVLPESFGHIVDDVRINSGIGADGDLDRCGEHIAGLSRIGPCGNCIGTVPREVFLKFVDEGLIDIEQLSACG